MNLLKILLIIPVFFGVNVFADHHGKVDPSQKAMSQNMKVAERWINAAYTNKDDFLGVVETHMADDGYNFPGRFVGFGFNFDPSQEDMVVSWVIEDSPAVDVLESGDTFVSVAGVPATKENRDNGVLSFAGIVGEPVLAVVRRDGKEVEVSFKRGLVRPRYSKSQVIENVETSLDENWGADEYRINEMVASSEDDVVYVWTWQKMTDTTTGLQFEANAVTRFKFNDNHQVIARASMTEESLIQSQLGFKVSR